MQDSEAAPPNDLPAPGSPEARNQGCICSPQQNRNGAGVFRPGLGRMFAIVYWCPLHGIDQLVAPARTHASELQ